MLKPDHLFLLNALSISQEVHPPVKNPTQQSQPEGPLPLKSPFLLFEYRAPLRASSINQKQRPFLS